MDIVYGRNSVLEALRANRATRKIVIAEGVQADKRMDEICMIAREREIVIEEVPRWQIRDMAHADNHQGVVGYFHSRQYLTIDQLIEQTLDPAFYLLFEGIQDPHNVGALSRTAEAAGCNGLILLDRRGASITSTVAKVSSGAIEYLPVAICHNAVQGLKNLKRAGIWCFGLDGESDTAYDQCDYSVPLTLIVGAEGSGLRPLVRKQCDVCVSIPMWGHVSSLNAAVAGSLVIYEVSRQRHGKG